jgi:hypothetical protein
MLTIPQTTTDVAAAQLAQRIIGGAIQNAVQTANLLDNGMAGQPATEARTAPNGQLIPSNPGTPDVTAEVLATAIGSSNLLKLGIARLALLGEVSDAQLANAYRELTTP